MRRVDSSSEACLPPALPPDLRSAASQLGPNSVVDPFVTHAEATRATNPSRRKPRRRAFQETEDPVELVVISEQQLTVQQMHQCQLYDLGGFRTLREGDVISADQVERFFPEPHHGVHEAAIHKQGGLARVAFFSPFMPIGAVVLDGQPAVRRELENHVNGHPTVIGEGHIMPAARHHERKQLEGRQLDFRVACPSLCRAVATRTIAPACRVVIHTKTLSADTDSLSRRGPCRRTGSSGPGRLRRHRR